MNTKAMPDYRYQGARALISLHEKHLLSCLEVWRVAKARDLHLPETADTDYQSLETLLRHILRAARGYMTWMCEKLDLPDPGIPAAPSAELVEQQAGGYVELLLEKWRSPLAAVERERFHGPVYPSRWGPEYCIDAMLEHAVMHPVRHEYQLRNLLRSE